MTIKTKPTKNSVNNLSDQKDISNHVYAIKKQKV